MTTHRHEKKNVLLLASAQALFQTTAVMSITLSGIIGLKLATDKALSTLPIALMILATAVMLIPASLIMQRYGRKTGFMLGAMSGAIAGALGAYAIFVSSFWLFAIATMFIGIYQAFAQYYRFAAADAASPAFKSNAISWVMTGGVVAAIAGPNLARLVQGLGTAPFMMPYLGALLLAVVAAFLLMRIDMPAPTHEEQHDGGRSLLVIAKQPVFLTALIGNMVGFSSMILVMTATPLAMQLCGQPLGAAATVIQWHVLGMFVPSFFTGALIKRFGVLQVMSAGVALLACNVLVALSGVELLHFVSGLVLLGVGWNFLFIGGTALLTGAYTPAERAKTQAMHDFLVFGMLTLASFSSGGLLHAFGWHALNLTIVPFLVVALVAIAMQGYARKAKA